MCLHDNLRQIQPQPQTRRIVVGIQAAAILLKYFFLLFNRHPLASIGNFNDNVARGLRKRYGDFSDFCIFDAEIGIYLGINVKVGTKERFGGIQERNGAAAYLHIITLDIGGNLFKTSVGFSYDIAKHGFGILGEKGFFELFSVKSIISS